MKKELINSDKCSWCLIGGLGGTPVGGQCLSLLGGLTLALPPGLIGKNPCIFLGLDLQMYENRNSFWQVPSFLSKLTKIFKIFMDLEPGGDPLIPQWIPGDPWGSGSSK